MRSGVDSSLPTPQAARRGGAVDGAAVRVGWLGIAVLTGAAVGALAFGYGRLPANWGPLLTLLAVFPFLAMIGGNLRRLLLAVIVLDIPFQLDVFIGRQDEDLFALQAYVLSVTTISLAVLYATRLAEGLATRRPWSGVTGRSRTTLFLTAYLAVALLSGAYARDPQLAAYELVLLLQMFLLYLYVVSTVDTRGELRFLVRMLLIAALLESLLMITIWLLGTDIEFAGIKAVIEGGRVAGTVGSFNRAASFLNLSLAVALAMLLSASGRIDRMLAATVVAAGSLALVLTLSRGGWIAFLCAVGVILVAAWRKGRLTPGVMVFLAVGLIGLFVALQGTIVARVSGVNASDPQTRIELMRIASRIIGDHVLQGVGVNNYGTVLGDYATPEFADTGLHQVHNKYLLVWAETGLVGLTLFLLFLGSILRTAGRSWRSGDDLLAFVALGLAAGVVAYMAQMPTERFVSRAQVQSLWLAAALVVTTARLSRVEPSTDSRSGFGSAPGSAPGTAAQRGLGE